MATDRLIESLRPGQPAALKTKADGTVLEGHHRLTVLRERGVDIDTLPRELLQQESEG
jgi:protein-tyrosine phosphatase